MKRLARILAAGVAMIVLASCSLPWEKAPAAAPSLPYPHCVQLLSQAMLSTTGTVAGSFACIDSAYAAQQATVGGPQSDADLAALAQREPIYTSVKYVGKTDRGYYFQYAGASGPGCFRFHANSAGQVDRVAYGSIACPSPLP